MLRRRRPLFNALSLSAAAALFLVTGVIGYTLDKHARFVAGTAWTDQSKGVLSKGATGFGVRVVVRLLQTFGRR